MSKFRSSVSKPLEDLLLVSRRETRCTKVRRWMVDNPVPVAVTVLAVAAWSWIVLDLSPAVALALTFGVTVGFFVWPLVAQAWRLRTEATLVAFLGIEWGVLPMPWFVTALAAQAIAFAVVPPLRRLVDRQFWCTVTQHRLRGSLERIATGKRVGRTPPVLWVRSTPVGERAYVWLTAGISASAFENTLPEIAAACWAREARITSHRRWSQLVMFDLLRRDQLTESVQPSVLKDAVLTDADAKAADYSVNQFLSRISPNDIRSNDSAVAPKQRTAKAADTAFADDPF